MLTIKRISLPVIVLSAAVGVSSCSVVSKIPLLDGSPVSDNMKYRSNDASIKALSIPPGLSKPAFDDSYSINKPVNPAPVAQQGGRVPSRQEMLNGQSAAAAQTQPVQQVQQQGRTRAMMTKVKSGEPALAVDASAGTTWSRLGRMLPEAGFEVTKRQPQQGIYTVVFKGDPNVQRGFLSRMLDSVDGVSLKSDAETDAKSPAKRGETYLLLLVGNDKQQSFIGARDKDGKALPAAVSAHILSLIKGQYER